MGSHLMWNFAHCVYILCVHPLACTKYTSSRLLISAFYYIITWCNLRKKAGGQWSKASFCSPGGHSYRGVTSRENYQLTAQMQSFARRVCVWERERESHITASCVCVCARVCERGRHGHITAACLQIHTSFITVSANRPVVVALYRPT